MKGHRAFFEKLRNDAAEAALIRNLATDKSKHDVAVASAFEPAGE
jgi:hypothetical protein